MRGAVAVRCGVVGYTCGQRYMVALAAGRHNPAIRTFHTRLRAGGKAPAMALVACMRKLLIILNGALPR
ncbi:hypothetical protein MELA_01946 [Candidatus Methylomirabilis lanthanidiphila]|uniref:Transposase n=1 Tax=Candidatus Methylomirabilis lanthanidiphila TaxID=2211376 RepID=A0A564ZJP3_9BACT|nr:hypothetical protein [Candidatus Methylomirabilis lanthanidiphila]VUZ85561.1 hypothetical protein MELA_01946 [Candidatus Methylomirabilis lanthanidiphila]